MERAAGVLSEKAAVGEESVVESSAMCFMLEALAATPNLHLDPDCF